MEAGPSTDRDIISVIVQRDEQRTANDTSIFKRPPLNDFVKSTSRDFSVGADDVVTEHRCTDEYLLVMPTIDHGKRTYKMVTVNGKRRKGLNGWCISADNTSRLVAPGERNPVAPKINHLKRITSRRSRPAEGNNRSMNRENLQSTSRRRHPEEGNSKSKSKNLEDLQGAFQRISPEESNNTTMSTTQDDQECLQRSSKCGERKSRNLRFYQNEIESVPEGALIEVMLDEWAGDYDLLEKHHGYIQWLFPISEKGMNSRSQKLELHEAKAIGENDDTRRRFIRAYRMMLDFYGFRLLDAEEGTVERSAHWSKRFVNLNRSQHNFLRITRIIRSMGELGFAHLQMPFVERLIVEAFVNRTLSQACESCSRYWIPAVDDERERSRLSRLIAADAEAS